MAMQIIPKAERNAAHHRTEDHLLQELSVEVNKLLKKKRGEICVDIPRNTSALVLELLIKKIKKAGYKVKFESDQREGDYLRIS